MTTSRNKSQTQIALVGASQSGKTTLAAGLVKSSDPDFSVGFATDATRIYLEPRIAGIEDGRWPEATVGENQDIALNLNMTGGRSMSVSFKEYMGERLRDMTYVERIVGRPQGTLILLGPGMDILRDARGRTEMLGNLKSVIDHLKRVQCAAIALVVTASDRLETDLVDFAPRFGEYLSEIENYLRTSGVPWKRFEVSITGKLQDQSHPSFCPGSENTAREPFLWLMDQNDRKSFQARCMKRARCGAWAAACLAIAGALGGLGMFLRERNRLAGLEERAEGAMARFAMAKTEKAESNMKEAVDGLFQTLEATATNRFRFSGLDARRSDNLAHWRGVYETNFVRHLEVKIADLEVRASSEGTEQECKDVDERIGAFKPVDSSLRPPLEKRWNEARPQIRDSYEVHARTENWKKLEEDDSREHKGIDDFKEKIDAWTPGTDKGKACKESLLKKFDAVAPGWRQEIADRTCREAANQLVKNLEQPAERKASGEIRDALERVFGFASAHTNATTSVVSNCVAQLMAKKAAALDAFLATFKDKWTTGAPRRPFVDPEDSAFIDDALDVADPEHPDEKLSVPFLAQLTNACVAAGANWDVTRMTEGHEFIGREIPDGRSAVDVFDAYRKWYEAYRYEANPGQEAVDAKVEQVVSGFLDEYVREVRKDFQEERSAFTSDAGRKKATRRFSDFQRLCLALKKDGCGLTKTWCAAFARECVDVGRIDRGMNDAFMQYFNITGLTARLVILDRAYKNHRREVQVFYWRHTCSGCTEEETIANGNAWDDGSRTIAQGPVKVSVNPWTVPSVRVWGKIYNGVHPDDVIEKTFWLHVCGGRNSEQDFSLDFEQGSGEWVKDFYECSVRIKGVLEGRSLFEMYEKHRPQARR